MGRRLYLHVKAAGLRSFLVQVKKFNPKEMILHQQIESLQPLNSHIYT